MSDIDLTDNNAILAEMRIIIEEVAGARKVAIDRDAAFDADLGLDSLTMVEIIVMAEESFNVRIPDSAFGKLVTVGDAVDFIAASAKEQATA